MAEVHDQDQKKADVTAIQAGKCPECMDDLSTDTDPTSHAENHWPTRTTKQDSDAARRKKLVTNYHARRDAAAKES